VDQAGIIGRKPRNLGLDAALAQAAAQPFDQPGPESVELVDLRHVDKDVGPAAAELFGVRHHRFQHRRKARGPGARGAQRQPVALGDPFQCRVAGHDAGLPPFSPRFIPMKVPTTPPPPCRNGTTQPYLVPAGKHTVQKLPDIKATSSNVLKLKTRIERWPIAGAFTISRGAKTEAVTVVAELSQGGLTGRGECVPYPRYGETPEATM